ncbi:MAG: AAC(3) family N-acetyltransferase [Candidatus Latescibacterota bacterium]|jgi:aminoglycoside N3'-acetyltransferase/aminopeptidase-like protein
MPQALPLSWRRLCRQVLPLLLGQARGARMIEAASRVVATDRWNSFDRFHETTRYLVQAYEEAGAQAEVYPVQTGGRLGSGRWVIHEAADVRSATVEVVSPVRQRLLDYRQNPWHVIQWSSATPREGVECELVILDGKEEVEKLPRDGLAGKVVLTRQGTRGLFPLLADKGAVGVITDTPVTAGPDALAWTKFGWGAIPLEHATARLVGFVLSENQGKALRRLAARHARVRLRLRADVRKYVGTHDVVSGLVRGAEDPQDEVWVIAHSGEPGALDNGSGLVVSLEIARILEELIAAGALPRPRRTIRLLGAYECYGFFAYLERTRRLQPPLAGVCLDTLGARSAVCDGRLEWHATIPLSAGFVDQLGETVLRAALRRVETGYRYNAAPFVSTADTLLGDPQYGFPCPWLTTHHRRSGKGFDAYHSSADTVRLLSPRGLQACAGAMAAYLYYLADMGTAEVLEIATSETDRAVQALGQRRLPVDQANFLLAGHQATLSRLQRWLWGGDRPGIMSRLDECREIAAEASERTVRSAPVHRRIPAAAARVPRRTALLSPTMENTPEPLAKRINGSGLRSWVLFYADGRRTIAEIARLAACEETASVGSRDARGQAPDLNRYVDYFEAHRDLGYVELFEPGAQATRAALVRDLKALGVTPGMDLMVHASLSALGPVQGGAETVVQALLDAVGRRGTLLLPSFNHRAAQVYNPLTTPTTNGAVPDAAWRRSEAVRSLHPTHAVTAIGSRAEEYCRDHLEVGIWAQDSPIGRLIHGGGYLLALGTTHNTSTAYHVAEMSVPCHCIDMFANEERVVMPDGAVHQVRGLAFRAGACPVPTSKLDQTLDRRKLQRRGKVANADCELVRALDLWRVRREHLRRVCPTCPVRPAVR